VPDFCELIERGGGRIFVAYDDIGRLNDMLKEVAHATMFAGELDN